jgi:hypothetical protein
MSLIESQQEALAKFPPSMNEYKGYQRDNRWRPLSEKDMESENVAPSDGKEYFLEACKANPTYYWLKDPPL